jgi:hypothetical protein
VCLTANLFFRSAASFASAAQTWPVGGAQFGALLRCYLKPLPLLHQVSCCSLAHALLASCAGAKLPHCFFQMIAGSLVVLPPAAGSPRLLNVGAGKLHARVRSSSHVRINAPCRIGDGVHVHVLARRWLLPAFAAGCRAASRGNLVRTCKHDCFVLVYCSLQCCCAIAAVSSSLY